MKHLVSVVALVLVVGCGSVTEGDMVGNWTGKIEMTDEGRKNLGAAAATIEAMTFDLEVHKDNTFDMSSSNVPSEGTWSYADQKLTLTTTKIVGVEVPAGDSAVKVFTVSAGGDKLTLQDPQGQTGTAMVFVRRTD